MTFVDTSYWVALRMRRDDHHDEARRLWVPGRALMTSDQVLGETWTFLRRREGHAAAVSFIDRAGTAPWLEVVHVDEAVQEAAWTWLRSHDERVYSFVDATSFALMRRLRIRQALAFDGDFTAAGFVELRP